MLLEFSSLGTIWATQPDLSYFGEFGLRHLRKSSTVALALTFDTPLATQCLRIETKQVEGKINSPPATPGQPFSPSSALM